MESLIFITYVSYLHVNSGWGNLMTINSLFWDITFVGNLL